MGPLEKLLKYAFENGISIYIEPSEKRMTDARSYIEVYNVRNRSRAKKVVEGHPDIVPAIRQLIDEVKSGAQVDLVREIEHAQMGDDYEFV